MTPILPVRVPELAKIFEASNEIRNTRPEAARLPIETMTGIPDFSSKLDLAPDKVATDIRTTRAVDAK